MQRILLAVDGSESSHNAASQAAELVESLKAEVTIITVLKEVTSSAIDAVAPSMPTASAPEQVEEILEQKEKEMKEQGRDILSQVAGYFKEKDIEPTTIIKHGNAADTICNYAEENDFDLIIVADKGMGGVKRFFLGSISDKVVRHADTSVMVVK